MGIKKSSLWERARSFKGKHTTLSFFVNHPGLSFYPKTGHCYFLLPTLKTMKTLDIFSFVWRDFGSISLFLLARHTVKWHSICTVNALKIGHSVRKVWNPLLMGTNHRICDFPNFFSIGNNSKDCCISGVFSVLGAPRKVIDTVLESSTNGDQS